MGYPSRTKQKTPLLQIPVDRADKCESAAAHGDQHGGGPEPFGTLCPQQWAKRVRGPETNYRASSIESSDHAFVWQEAPAAAAAITPRALT